MTVYGKSDIFFACSLIELIGRRTKSHRRDVVASLKTEGINHILDHADVYHCMCMEQAADEIQEMYSIKEGSYDTVSQCMYTVPSATAIGKVYQRLAFAISKTPNAADLERIFSSFISDENI